ncbi:MAG: restriction endonuclease subunit S [Nitrospiraceae bacterium]|nr:restriction endonuclease subunit S [Nitrospiraceae bacterium]
MVLENTHWYYRTFDELESRLDFVFYHPDFDFIKSFRKSDKTFKSGNIISEPEYGNSLSGKETGVTGFLNGQHISETGELIFKENALYVDALLPDGDLLEIDNILISRSGTVGKATVITDEYEGFAFGSFYIRFRIKDKSTYLPAFFSKFINSDLGVKQIELLKTGSVQSNINSDQIKDINIPEIKSTRQKEILKQIAPLETESKTLKAKATKLQNEAVNYILEVLGIETPESPNYFFKSGAEKQTLTFDVFPDAIDDRLHYLYLHPKYKALEEVKAKFKTVSLESICTKAIAPGVQPIYDDTGEIIVLKTVDLKNKYIDYDNALRVSAEFYKANKFAEVHKGEIILAATGYVSMGKVDIYDNDEPALISGELLSFKVNDNYDPYFIAYFLRSHLGQIQIEKYWTGSSGQIHLYDKDVNKFIIPSYESISKAKQTEIAKAIRKKIEEAIRLEKQAIEKQTEAKRFFERLVMAGIK